MNRESTPAPGGGRRIGHAIAAIAGWHALFALVFTGWVLTWPPEINIGHGIVVSRWVLVVLLTMIAVAPALCLSLAVAFGMLAILQRWRGPSGIALGTIATLAGLAADAVALALIELAQP